MKLPIAVLLLSGALWAQTGTVSNIKPSACPVWALAGMKCWTAQVSCPGTLTVPVTYAIQSPTIPALGTIVFLFGTNTNLGPNQNAQYIPKYLAAGYKVVEFNWVTQWEDTGLKAKSVLAASCRPATMIQYVHDNLLSGEKYMAQGYSAGAGALAYAMSYYGAGNILDAAEFLSGPVYSRIDEGCEVPWVPPVTILPTHGDPFVDGPQYISPTNNRITMVTGFSCLPDVGITSATAAAAWQGMSIVQSSGQFNFSTRMSFWECDNGMNPVAAQGYLYAQNLTSPWKLTSLSGCRSAEDVWNGTTQEGLNGATAIIQDMESQ